MEVLRKKRKSPKLVYIMNFSKICLKDMGHSSFFKLKVVHYCQILVTVRLCMKKTIMWGIMKKGDGIIKKKSEKIILILCFKKSKVNKLGSQHLFSCNKVKYVISLQIPVLKKGYLSYSPWQS